MNENTKQTKHTSAGFLKKATHGTIIAVMVVVLAVPTQADAGWPLALVVRRVIQTIVVDMVGNALYDGVKSWLEGDAHEARQAADRGNPAAQYALGLRYATGQGVPMDAQQAVRLFTEAANRGYAPAQNMIGYLYKHGINKPQDYSQAVYWYSKAAAQGDALAQSNLGQMYKLAKGVSRDYSKAFQLYSQSAAQGCRYGEVNLADLYHTGRGVTQDLDAAVTLYCRAAAKGSPLASERLSKLGASCY